MMTQIKRKLNKQKINFFTEVCVKKKNLKESSILAIWERLIATITTAFINQTFQSQALQDFRLSR